MDHSFIPKIEHFDYRKEARLLLEKSTELFDEIHSETPRLWAEQLSHVLKQFERMLSSENQEDRIAGFSQMKQGMNYLTEKMRDSREERLLADTINEAIDYLQKNADVAPPQKPLSEEAQYKVKQLKEQLRKQRKDNDSQ